MPGSDGDFTLEKLKDEIVNDPESLGYKNSATPNDWKDDQVIADLINDRSTLIVDKEKVSAANVRSATTFDGYDTLSIDEQEWLRWKTGSNGFEEENIDLTDDFKLQLSGRALTVNGVAGAGGDNSSFWSASQRGTMAPAMLALFEVAGSRGEVLWGERTGDISTGQIGAAFNLI